MVNLTGNRCWNKSTAGEGTVKEGVSETVDYRLRDCWAESSLTDGRENTRAPHPQA